MLYRYHRLFAQRYALTRGCSSPKRWHVRGTFRYRNFAFMHIGSYRFFCRLGYGGVRAVKKEGDGATPKGLWPLIAALYRADRVGLVNPCDIAIHCLDGWCDHDDHALYNQAVRRPFKASHEVMMRKDILYDRVIIPAHNMFPSLPKHGSAVFIHQLHHFSHHKKCSATAGCVGLKAKDMKILMRLLAPATYLYVS